MVKFLLVLQWLKKKKPVGAPTALASLPCLRRPGDSYYKAELVGLNINFIMDIIITKDHGLILVRAPDVGGIKGRNSTGPVFYLLPILKF